LADTFRCTVVTPEQQVFDEQVVYASIPGWDGQVGVMHNRAPLLVKLGDGPLRLDDAAGKSAWFLVTGGFGQMKDNQLTLLTSRATPAAEVSEADARAALKEAEAFVPHSEEDFARKDRDLRRARAMLAVAAKR
jgi:F-type H+-transporting ATPase subunit epsilon